MADKKDLDLKDGSGLADVQVTTMKKPGYYDPMQETKMTRLGLSWESFKRAPGSTGGQVVHGQEHADPEHANDSPMLQQQMKTRHLVSDACIRGDRSRNLDFDEIIMSHFQNMIAVGGSIGTGLFIGSGRALRTGGPAGEIMSD